MLKNITDLFTIDERFLRSTNLERDFNNPLAMSGYILTDHSKKCVARIAMGLENNSGQRAWRITGDYGSGKSSFALYLAHLLSKQEHTASLSSERLIESPHKLLPVLITVSRQPLGQAILKGLLNTISELPANKSRRLAISELNKTLHSKTISSETIANTISMVNRMIIEEKYGTGILIIMYWFSVNWTNAFYE